MSFSLDDCAFGGQSMCGVGQPIALGVGPKKIRGSSFVEVPMQVGKSGAYSTAKATLMVGQTGNADCPSPDRSLFVKGDAKIEGDKRTSSALLVQGDVKIEGDGRTSNARVLKNNLQRNWTYFEDFKNDQNILYLNEKPIGKTNLAQIKFYKS